MELNSTYRRGGEVNGSEKWKQGKNIAICGRQLAAIYRCTFKLVRNKFGGHGLVSFGSWVHLAEERDKWRAMVMNLGFPQNLKNISRICGTISLSRSTVLDGVRLFVGISSCGFERIAESHTDFMY